MMDSLDITDLFIEQLLGLKINFHKSELFCYGDAKDCVDQYSHILDVYDWIWTLLVVTLMV